MVTYETAIQDVVDANLRVSKKCTQLLRLHQAGQDTLAVANELREMELMATELGRHRDFLFFLGITETPVLDAAE
jgi:hypothetical protein